MEHSQRDPDLWQRVREAQVTAVFGRLPDAPQDIRLLRVSCEVAPAALRPLLEARRLTEAILGEARSKPQERPKGQRWRTLFGDTPERTTEAVVVEQWNQLAKLPGSRWVVVFDAVELADPATLAALTLIVKKPGWMRLPLVLVFHGEPKEAAAELLAAVQARDGEGVIRFEQAQAAEAAPTVQWNSLPAKVLRVLRAGALIGPGFEAKIVGELLSLEPLEVLERLQQSIDLGVPLEDRGEGRFSLPTAALSALSSSLMPSLAQAWHRRLGKLLGARAGEEAAAGARPARPPVPRAKGRAFAVQADTLAAEIIDLSAEVVDLAEEIGQAAATLEPIAAGQEGMSVGPDTGVSEGPGQNVREGMSVEEGERRSDPAAETREDMSIAAVGEPEGPPHGPMPAQARPLAGRRTVIAPAPSRPPIADEPTLPPTPVAEVTAQIDEDAPPPEPAEWGTPVAVVPTRLDDPLVDEARAAEHMRLAGDFDAAAQHLCEAARKAGEMGAPQAAVQHAKTALEMLATLPPSAIRRQLRVTALSVIGRVQWQSAGYEMGFTLGQALATLDTARAELEADAPAELAVELTQALAGVCFDLGDLRSLERALAELETASKILRETGDEVGAACLLNDQAAVLVRLGNPGRALPLLKKSRQAFDARAGEDQVALRELAETEHLFARLPLSATLRPGREQEGFEMGLTHARAAERAYHELGEARELGRVWETMGRLELRRGQLEAAKQRLESSLEVLTQLGDLTGLAQTTEALAELRAATGADAEAVTQLRDSVVFNRDKGSPLGLMSNRRVFTALVERLKDQPQHADGLQEVAILLSAGERELGITA